MSLPAVKASPSAPISTARTSARAAASRNAAVSASYIAPVMAFLLSGRLKRSSSTPLASWIRMWDIAGSCMVRLA